MYRKEISNIVYTPAEIAKDHSEAITINSDREKIRDSLIFLLNSYYSIPMSAANSLVKSISKGDITILKINYGD